MTTIEEKPRTRPTSDDVMQQVAERLPSLVDFMFLDRAWVWYCGPSLQGNHNAETRLILGEIGFRFCPKGHVMQDGKTVGSWSHSCRHPMYQRRRPQTKRRPKENDRPADIANAFRELGL